MAAANRPVTWGKRILLLLLLVFVIIQFLPKDRWSNELIAKEQSMTAIMQPPQEVETLLATACYDCHSYNTEYPWYADLAPVSFWIDDHNVLSFN